MSKLLYVAPVVIDLDRLNGVAKKILNHFKIFSKYYNVELISYGPNCLYYFNNNKIDIIHLEGLGRRLQLYKFLLSHIKICKCDFIYFRYHLSDFLFICLLKIIKQIVQRIVIEIPTYPYQKELLKSKNGYLRYLNDSLSKPFLKLYIDRIVTYSEDKRIYGIDTINTINGIVFDDINFYNRKLSSSSINLISVSVTVLCHGFDRVIEGLNIYYKNGGKVKVFYHLVGNGDELLKYQELVKKYNLEQFVLIYGFKSGDELEAIYDKADIAINSLGIHRIGLKQESTLKSKEYAAKGLPIVSSYDIDTFSKADNERYVFRVKPDESPIDIKSLIEFYNKVNSNGDVADEIRRISKERCDMEITLQPVIRYFNEGL